MDLSTNASDIEMQVKFAAMKNFIFPQYPLVLERVEAFG